MNGLKYEIIKSDQRGHVKNGWLDSKHTFSFGGYRNVNQMNFSELRVINEDKIDGGRGFPSHPHNNMEIFTYVLDGALEHKDSMGNGEVINPGDVQVMSAGTGVYHSEFNPLPNTKTHLLQIWLYPNVMNEEPTYQQKNFSNEDKKGCLKLILSEDEKDGSLKIKQDAKIYAGLFDSNDSATLKTDVNRSYFIHVIKGEVKINGIKLNAGDAIKIYETINDIEINDGEKSEILLFDLIKH